MTRGAARILIVNGCRDTGADLARALTAEGYSVRRAGDACEAVDALRCERADLLLIDTNLPGWIGGDALAFYAAGREIAAVMMSDEGEAETRFADLPYPRLRKGDVCAEPGRVVREALCAVYGAS